MEAINSRFQAGRPSNSLADAGILLRQFDELSAMAADAPWQPCPPDFWCKKFHAQWPSTIVNAKARMLYFEEQGGMVLDASLVSIFCAYYGDGSKLPPCCASWTHCCSNLMLTNSNRLTLRRLNGAFMRGW